MYVCMYNYGCCVHVHVHTCIHLYMYNVYAINVYVYTCMYIMFALSIEHIQQKVIY